MKVKLKLKYKMLIIIVISVLIAGIMISKKVEMAAIENNYGNISKVTTSKLQEESSYIEDPWESGRIIDQDVLVTVFDVGDGLSVFIDAGEKELLYDCGSKEYGNSIRNKISETLNNSLDYVILSYDNENHMGGYEEISKHFKIGTTIYGENGKSEMFKKVSELAIQEGEFHKDRDEEIILGDNVIFSIFNVVDNQSIGANNSVLGLLKVGNTSMIITGDAEKGIQRKVTSQIGEKMDIVIAGKHGSRVANYFIQDEVDYSVEYFLVSCANNSLKGYPDKEVIEQACNETRNVFTTRNGDIKLTLNGNDIKDNRENGEELEEIEEE